MRGMLHPLSKAVYELCDEGVLVTTADGHSGAYDTKGRWLSGDKLPVDPHMCTWIGEGPRKPEDLSTNRRFKAIIDQEKTI